MSKYNITDIENLINKSNKKNKTIIVETIKNIIEEDNTLDIKLMNIENINRQFFKLAPNDSNNTEEYILCTICQDEIKSKEHKVKLPNCNHIFHKKCMNKFMKKNLLNFNCPNCKKCYKNNLEEIISNFQDL